MLLDATRLRRRDRLTVRLAGEDLDQPGAVA
jgi:hypothetical protein